MRARLAGLLAVLMLLAGCAREIPSTYIPPEPTATPQPEPEEKGGFPVAPVAAGAAIAVLLLAGGGVLWFRRSRR